MTKSATPLPGRVFEITALSNPRIKAVRALVQKKNRDAEDLFLAEGMKLIRDAFESGWKIDTLIYAAKMTANPQLQAVAAKARVTGTEILEVSEKVLASIARRDNPQMVLGVMRQQWSSAPSKGLKPEAVWVALDRVRDPGNLGSIIRTADAAGADGIVLVGETTDPFSIEAVRASMGSVFNLALARMTLAEFLAWRHQWPGLVVGTHLTGASDYRTIDYSTGPALLLMGNEQQGLPADLAEICDHLAVIPMAGKADSLNLAVATGVMLFQMAKKPPPADNPDMTP